MTSVMMRPMIGSPDGEWIASTDGENQADVWVVRPDGAGLWQLTTVG
jgi:hypothetical protein